MVEIQHTLVEALILVILVVFIFLQGWRATLIPLLAVPVSLVSTFALFPLFGFSVNTLSLFGLVLAIGLVVDDAIVVVEAVEHHIEHGLSPRDATLKAMEEVSGPVIAHRARARRRVYPDGFRSGNHRTLVSAVRRHHRGLDDHLGVQCAHALSPALSAMLLKPKKKGRGLLQTFLRLVQSRLRRATDRLRTSLSRLLIRKVAGRGHHPGRLRLPGRVAWEAHSRQLSAGGRSGLLLCPGHICPTAASFQRTDEVMRQVRGDPEDNTRASNTYTTVIGFNLLSGVKTTYSGVLLHLAQGMETSAKRPRRNTRPSSST